jgi:hypothetical protein|tara:strand:+ start:638 stop:1090 length:453 start_codon:yes stop_codon:yes gene_type:complete
MSEELLKAISNFDWNTQLLSKFKIHYNPTANGSITEIGADGQTNSGDPYIEVDAKIGLEFISGKRYKRSYHIVDGILEMRNVESAIFKASDNRLDQITDESQIDVGTYFITVKGDSNLVIDTVEVVSSNKDTQVQRIKEYLENNDCYKDK